MRKIQCGPKTTENKIANREDKEFCMNLVNPKAHARVVYSSHFVVLGHSLSFSEGFRKRQILNIIYIILLY